jgi:phage head maturation protease
MPTKTDEDQGTGHMEYKCVGIAGFKSIDTDDEKGVVETYVSLTGLRDNVKDIIEPGAYEKSLIVRTPKGVWHHDWKESVSKTLAIKELLPGDSSLPKELPNGDPWPSEAGALFVKTQFNLNTQRGREAYEDVKFFGEQQEWSIGYNVPVGGATTDQKTGVRRIHTLDLYEYSPVLFGAMPSTHTASVKSAQMAYKALFDSDENPDEVEDGEEFEMVVLEKAEAVEDVENKEWGFLDEDGYFTKASNLVLSGPQAAKLTRAAYALIELLRDASPEADEEPVEDEEEVSDE